MPRTRSSKSAVKQVSEASQAEEEAPKLSQADSNPPKLFILPKSTSKDARIVTLNDPAKDQPTRYFFCPQKKAFYEFRLISAPRTQPRSWLITPNSPDSEGQNTRAGADDDELGDNDRETTDSPEQTPRGYVSRSQDLFVATPFDPLFFLLPIIWPVESSTKDSRKNLFLTLDDHIDMAHGVCSQLSSLLRQKECHDMFQYRLRSVCDVVEAGDESMFRLSKDKLAKEIYAKAERLATGGLPPSLEDRFVSRVLDVPVLSVKRAETTIVATETLSMSQPAAAGQDTQASEDQSTSSASSTAQQNTSTTATTSFSVTETTASSVMTTASAPENIVKLLRLRTALAFILRSYIRPDLHRAIQEAIISSTTALDFAPLDEHLKRLAASKAEALALHAVSDNISRKRSADTDEAAELRAEKKRKKEAEEKKAKSKPRALKDLGKVNTSGMKKMSAFFTKKAVVKS